MRHAQAPVQELACRPADRAAAGRGRCGAGRACRKPRPRRAPEARPQPRPSARSMPAPAMAANSRSMRSTTPSTISNASACASSPRRAMPTCCWSPARSPRTCARRWSAPTPRRPIRNGWSRSATARLDGGIFAGSYAVVGGVSARRAGRSAHPRLPAEPGSLLKGCSRSFPTLDLLRGPRFRIDLIARTIQTGA